MIIEGHIITNVAEMLDFCEAAIARTDDDPSTIPLHVPQDMRIAEHKLSDGSARSTTC